MADAAKEDATKQRIITHMNGDHQDSLALYLRHQHSLDEKTASTAKLIDINLKQVVIIAAGKCYTLTLDPPMASMREARERMVALDTDARKALNLPAHSHGALASPPKITRFVPPSGFDCVVWTAVISTLVVFSRQANVQPGGWAYENLGIKLAPRFAAFCQAVQPWLFAGMLALHGAEAAFVGMVKMPRYGVSTGGLLWWKWVLSTFIDGFFTQKRLAILVKRQQAAQVTGATNGKAH